MFRGALYGLEIGGSLVVVAAAGHQEDGQGEGIVFKVLIFVKIRGRVPYMVCWPFRFPPTLDQKTPQGFRTPKEVGGGGGGGEGMRSAREPNKEVRGCGGCGLGRAEGRQLGRVKFTFVFFPINLIM